MSHFTNTGFIITFSSNHVAITKGKFHISGVQSGPLFTYSLYMRNPFNKPSLNAIIKALPTKTWHLCMGHVNWETLK